MELFISGSLWDPSHQTVKCYYHKVGSVRGLEDDGVAAIVRVNLDEMSNTGHLQQALAHEAQQTGETYGEGFLIQYEDSDADHVTLTTSSDLDDVRKYAHKIHIFQKDPLSCPPPVIADTIANASVDTSAESFQVAIIKDV